MFVVEEASPTPSLLRSIEETLLPTSAWGDMVKVKLIGLDPKTGKFKLSRKVLMPKPEGVQQRPRESESDRPNPSN